MEAAEIDKELSDLEHKAEHLRALYEQYFMGLDRMEPLIPRRDVERRIIVLRREQLRNTAQRFKFNTLVQRFNTMQMYWSRIVREIENGTYRRDVIRAAARFGEGALAVLGKKKTKDLTAAIAKAQEKRKVDEPLELGADDLIEEEADETPTPPKLVVPVSMGVAPLPPVPTKAAPVPPVPMARPPASIAGLGEGDLPVVGPPMTMPAAGPRPPGVVAPLLQPVSPLQRSLGVRSGAVTAPDPGSTVRGAGGDAKKRVAELAAQLPPQRQSQPQTGFGELDLDFDDSPAAPPVAPVAPKPSVVATPVRPAARPLPVVTAPPPRAAPPSTALSGFGELDLPLEADPSPQPPAPPAPSPGFLPKTPQRPAPKPAPAPDAAARPAAPDGDLPDHRIRQIYAKYVETKRSTQESTAGVTFEKLAASLRAQANKLKSAHPTRSIDYEVVIKDGKTHLKPVLR